MARWNKKSKLITGIAVAGAAIIAVGGVALVSKGFKNMDARDWVGGYEHVLEVSEDAQYLCTTCNVDGTWNQEKRAEISFKSKDDDGDAAHSSAKLYDQDGKVFKRANVTISANIGIKGSGYAGIAFGGSSISSPYEAISFLLHYDEESELLNVVAYLNDSIEIVEDYNQVSHPDGDDIYVTNSYSLSYYGISSIDNIKFSVTKTLTSNGSKYEVKVGNKVLDFITGANSDGDFIVSADSTLETKGAFPVYLEVYDTSEATFKEVKWSE